jgi:hypothetical protein
MQMACFLTKLPLLPTTKQPGPNADRPDTTHPFLDVFVGAGIQQHPRAVRVTIPSGPNQRRPSVLRARVMCRHRLPHSTSHTDTIATHRTLIRPHSTNAPTTMRKKSSIVESQTHDKAITQDRGIVFFENATKV